MPFFSSFLNSFVCSSSRMSDASMQNYNLLSSEELKKKEKSLCAPIPVSYFPINVQISCL
ncbi:hypothetical protein Pfo_005595 [Paulownia fortunei]|nr:hypothetical protein Pfo_005595 [Paulownia fortunei]